MARIITIITHVITFIQGIYNYIPETNHVSSVQSVAAVLSVLTICATCNVTSSVKYVLYFYISCYYYYCCCCILHSHTIPPSTVTNKYETNIGCPASRSLPTSSPKYIAPFSHPLCLCLRTYFHSLLAIHIPGMHCQFASYMMRHRYKMCTNRTVRIVPITTTETNHSGDKSTKFFNPLNAELNPIRYLLALVGAHHIVHVSGIRVNRPIAYCIVSLEDLRLSQSGAAADSSLLGRHAVSLSSGCVQEDRTVFIFRVKHYNKTTLLGLLVPADEGTLRNVGKY